MLNSVLHEAQSNCDSQQENVTQAFWHDPALPFVESRRACQSRACYRPHHHPTFSIGAVDEGTSIFTGAGDEPNWYSLLIGAALAITIIAMSRLFA